MMISNWTSQGEGGDVSVKNEDQDSRPMMKIDSPENTDVGEYAQQNFAKLVEEGKKSPEEDTDSILGRSFMLPNDTDATPGIMELAQINLHITAASEDQNRTIEQDQTQSPKRLKIETDFTTYDPEEDARLIIGFPKNILSLLITYLNYEDLKPLMSLCYWTQETLKITILEKANIVSNSLYLNHYRNLALNSKILVQKHLDTDPKRLKDFSLITKSQAYLDHILNEIAQTKQYGNYSMAKVREAFCERFFQGDEVAFMEHILYFKRTIEENRPDVFHYRKEHRNTTEPVNIVDEFMRLEKEAKEIAFSIADEDEMPDSKYEYQYENDKIYIRTADYEIESSILPIGIFTNAERIASIEIVDSHALSLPPQIGDCINLVSLQIDDHILSLPPEIGKLKNLRELSLIFCFNLKFYPDEITELKNLKLLNLNTNDCSGDPCYITKTCADQQCVIYFDDLPLNQKEWLWDLKDNGCKIEGIYIPPRG